MCAVCLCSVTAHSSNARLQLPGALDSSPTHGNLVSTLVYLMKPKHPARFRTSFSRVLVAVSPSPCLAIFVSCSSPSSHKPVIVKQICMNPAGKSALASSEIATTRALCSSVFDLYKECVELRHVESTQANDAKSFSATSIRRVAAALRVLLESSAALRQLVVVKRGLQSCAGAIKELFLTIRMEGGFGGKAKHPREDYLVSLCARIEIHFDILAALVGEDAGAQEIALVRIFSIHLDCRGYDARLSLTYFAHVFVHLTYCAA